MKNSTKTMYVNKFFRAFPEEFTVKEFIRYMSYVDCKITKKEAEDLLAASPYIFELEEGRYQTRAGAFTNKLFSVVLSEEECANKCFLPGHRCVPFVDQEVMSYSLLFIWNNSVLPTKIVEYSKEFALDHFSLYGEEYESQYIANDPGMDGFELADNDFELPMKVKLTSVDLEPLFERYKIEPGDRLLFTVENWDEGIINVSPCLREKSKILELTDDDIKRNQWYKVIEKALKELFKTRGPRSSIEEQLADVFFEYSDELCTRFCGSVEEFLKKTKAVSMELFGVETRLWNAGETVPAMGEWNYDNEEEYGFKHNLVYSVPDFVLDEFIKDHAFQKKNNLEELLNEVFPACFFMPPEHRQDLLLHIINRNDIILSNYNWFADHQLGDIRHKALLLYTKINGLIYEIDRIGGKFNSYPQQELVILIQLYTHLSKLMETIAFDPNSLTGETETISVSLDGMEFNFEDIEGALRNAVAVCKKNDFTVI